MARKILLADDSVTAQNMGRRILTDAGYEVATVNNGSAALKRIAEWKPDLIVLDVYMPGYGGLEVCQRLREAPETARIPVLLSVGKLEPFKADDSKRVRADGFIVKPFEASELLTALAKLEDKIVPQGQPHKAGRFGKAMAAADDAATAKEFGDSETGWKNRLSIPPPHSKPREVAAENVEATAKESSSEGQQRNNEELKPVEMKSGVEEALMATLPPDVTPEEIAAIRAAAAAFSAPSDEIAKSAEGTSAAAIEHPAEPEAVKAEEQPAAVARMEETNAVTFASAPETQAEKITQDVTPAAQAETVVEAPPIEAVAEVVASPAGITDPPAETAASVASGNPSDDEVTAALASLAPGNGNGAANSSEVPSELNVIDRAMVTLAAGAAAVEFHGPRWLAEAVALAEDESAVDLEREMQWTHAGMAAADAARVGHGGNHGGEVASFASSNSKPEEPASPAAAVTVPEPTPASAVGETSLSDGSAPYAAAAAAGADSGQPAMISESGSQTVATPEVSDGALSASDRQGEGELAAAWANWRQIRDTVLTAHVPDGGVESKAEQQPTPQAVASSGNGEESSEISDIVDSVLADLKPKLMEEIKRKMGKESKKK